MKVGDDLCGANRRPRGTPCNPAAAKCVRGWTMGFKNLTRISFLDRLLDIGLPDGAGGPVAASSALKLETALTRDLEWLLNTPRIFDRLGEPWYELRRSLYSYGFPDVSSMTQHAGLDHELERAIVDAIATFEPRLEHVTVTASPPVEPNTRRFILKAVLRAEPAPHQVVLDARLDLGTHRFSVGGDQYA
jgi:type VI secretion system lysozyme-like protein